MGLSTDYFTALVDSNLVCPICLDVFDNPQSLLCGHTAFVPHVFLMRGQWRDVPHAVKEVSCLIILL